MDDTLIAFDRELNFRARILDNIGISFLYVIFISIVVIMIKDVYIGILGAIIFISSLTWGIIRKSKYYLSYLSISDRKITLKYMIYNKQFKIENISIDQFKLQLSSDWYDSRAFYNLDVYINNQKLFTQRAIGDWNEAKYYEVIKSLEENR